MFLVPESRCVYEPLSQDKSNPTQSVNQSVRGSNITWTAVAAEVTFWIHGPKDAKKILELIFKIRFELQLTGS